MLLVGWSFLRQRLIVHYGCSAACFLRAFVCFLTAKAVWVDGHGQGWQVGWISGF